MAACRVEGARFTFLWRSNGLEKVDLRDVHDREVVVAWTIARLASHQVPRGDAEASQRQSDQ